MIDAINKETDYTADGLLPGIDWTTSHTQVGDPSCFALLQIKDSKFVPDVPREGQDLHLPRHARHRTEGHGEVTTRAAASAH